MIIPNKNNEEESFYDTPRKNKHRFRCKTSNDPYHQMCNDDQLDRLVEEVQKELERELDEAAFV